MSKIMTRVWRYIFESGDAKRIAKQHPDISMLKIIKDIPYIDDGEVGHLLDIYRRKDGDPSDPVMINIHGGGLFASYKEVNAHFNYEIAKMGYTVVSLSYRRIPETTLWHQVDDIMHAFSFLEKNGERLGLNLDSLYISGDSAGGGLSLALIMYLRDHNIDLPHGVITMSAWTDLTKSGDSYSENFDNDPVFGGTKHTLVYKKGYYGQNDPSIPYISPVFQIIKI